MADWTLKAHDLLPSIQATLQYKTTGAAVDLTQAVGVKFIMRGTAALTPKVNSPAVIVDAPNGVVRYDWVAADVDTPGNYQAEWQVMWGQSKPQTFPTETYHTITVGADLDNSA